ncbi:MAG: ABC transporter permease [Quadrisphaera sp.]
MSATTEGQPTQTSSQGGPGQPPRAGTRPARHRTPLVGTWGLPVLTVLLFAVFALVLPNTFPTSTNLRAILTNQSIPALLALGAMIPIVTGRFDLSIGYGIGLAHVVTMWLLVNTGLSWPVVFLLVLVGGVVVGLVNGLLVEAAQIDSFIATLGTGSVLYALTGWITGGGRIVPGTSGLPPAFTDLTNSSFLFLPVTFWYVVVLGVLLWVALEHLPIGRYLYVVGANPRAAALVGIRSSRTIVLAFVGSAVVTALAGVLLAAQQQIGDPSAGQSYLLPAFVGALLGSTTIKPGRANAVGTLVAVAVLAVGPVGPAAAGRRVLDHAPVQRPDPARRCRPGRVRRPPPPARRRCRRAAGRSSGSAPASGASAAAGAVHPGELMHRRSGAAAPCPSRTPPQLHRHRRRRHAHHDLPPAPPPPRHPAPAWPGAWPPSAAWPPWRSPAAPAAPTRPPPRPPPPGRAPAPTSSPPPRPR